MVDRYDSLSHQALMASVGSMKRRWSEDIYLAPPQSVEDFFSSPAADGVRIDQEMGAAIRQLELLAHAIRTTSYIEPEPLEDSVPEAVRNELDGTPPASVKAGLVRISELNEDIYERLASIRMVDWKNEASSGSMTFDMSDLAKGVSRVNAERLMRAKNALTALA